MRVAALLSIVPVVSIAIAPSIAVCQPGFDDAPSIPIPPQCDGLAPAAGGCGAPSSAGTCDEDTGVCCREWCVEWTGEGHPRWGSTCTSTRTGLDSAIERALSEARSSAAFFRDDYVASYYASHSEPCCSGCCGETTDDASDSMLTTIQSSRWMAAATPPLSTTTAMIGWEALAHGTSLLFPQAGRNPFAGVGATTGVYSIGLAQAARRASCVQTFMTAWTSQVSVGTAFSAGPGNVRVPRWVANLVNASGTSPTMGVSTIPTVPFEGQPVPVRSVSRTGTGRLIFGSLGPIAGAALTLSQDTSVAFVCQDATGQIVVGGVALATSPTGGTRVIGTGCDSEEVAEAATLCPPGLQAAPDATGAMRCECPVDLRWDSSRRTCMPESCDGGAVWDALDGRCACPAGDVWNTADHTCRANPCVGGSVYVATRGACVCPDAAPLWSHGRSQCIGCDSGQVYDAATSSCRCPEGAPVWSATASACVRCSGNSVFDRVTRTCRCPSGTPWNDATGRCEACPPDREARAARCLCRAPFIERSGVCECPAGLVAAGGRCVCPASAPRVVSGACAACPYGQQWNGTSCVCGPEELTVGERCFARGTEVELEGFCRSDRSPYTVVVMVDRHGVVSIDGRALESTERSFFCVHTGSYVDAGGAVREVHGTIVAVPPATGTAYAAYTFSCDGQHGSETLMRVLRSLGFAAVPVVPNMQIGDWTSCSEQ